MPFCRRLPQQRFRLKRGRRRMLLAVHDRPRGARAICFLIHGACCTCFSQAIAWTGSPAAFHSG
jgi:hypothetical protein